MFDNLKRRLDAEVHDLRKFMHRVMMVTGCSEFQALRLATNIAETQRKEAIELLCFEKYTVRDVFEAYADTLPACWWALGHALRNVQRRLLKLERLKL